MPNLLLRNFILQELCQSEAKGWAEPETHYIGAGINILWCEK